MRWTGGSYAFTVGVVKGLELNDIGVSDNTHNLEFTVLARRIRELSWASIYRMVVTLNRLSWRTRLMAASSPDGDSLV